MLGGRKLRKRDLRLLGGRIGRMLRLMGSCEGYLVLGGMLLRGLRVFGVLVLFDMTFFLVDWWIGCFGGKLRLRFKLRLSSLSTACAL